MFKCGVLKHTLEGLLACLNVEFSSIHWKESACLKVEFSSIHWKVFLLQAYIKCGVLKHTLEGPLAF